MPAGFDAMYQTRRRVFHPISKHRESGFKMHGTADFFLTNFELLKNRMI